MGLAQSRVEVQFHVGAEQFLSVALASMVSKYLRELAMQAFNEFWRRHVPDLRPTAGYPTDARRFKQAIEPMCKQLGIDDRLLWRCR
jgi:ribonuclease HII